MNRHLGRHNQISNQVAVMQEKGYINCAPAKSGVGFGDSNFNKTAHTRPLLRIGAFFVSAICLMAACVGRPSGLPMSVLVGSPTPHTLSPLFGDLGDSKSLIVKTEVIMTALIPIASRTIQGKPTETVHARKLHALLNVKSKYADWIRSRIALGFVENKDFISLSKKIEGNNASKSDHYLNLDMAKHIAMMERNEMGQKARDYFIACEKKVKEQPAQLPLLPSQPFQDYIDKTSTEIALRAKKKAEEDLRAIAEDALRHHPEAALAKLKEWSGGANQKILSERETKILQVYVSLNIENLQRLNEVLERAKA